MRRAVLGSLLFAPLVASGAAAQTSRPQPSLSSRLPGADKVPACAKLKEIKPGDDPPCGMKTNPIVSGDRAFATCMADMVLTRMAKDAGVKPDQATEAAFVMYEARSEIGVIVLSFADAATTSTVSKAIEKIVGAEPRAAVLAGGTAAGFMSCDPGVEEDCCREVKAVVLESWKQTPAR